MMRSVSLGVCGLLFAACAYGPADESVGQEAQGIVRGTPERHLPQVVAVHVTGFNGRTLCSGTYIAPRVVLTAAHCMRADAVPGQLFVYYGKDYLGDVAALPNIPEPGMRSVWARAETSVVHPQYDASVNYPDMAVLFLDRELPFEPLPLDRRHVSDREKHGEIVGWGGSRALTPDISQVEGAGIERSARVRLLGSPTEADFHFDDPNPGILVPDIRVNLLKTDGRAPHANACAGDSGGPLLVDEHGRDRVAGVGFWTGLSCEDYSMFTRIDPFLDFLDQQIERAGHAPLVPRLECVEERPGASLRAHFGYANQNGVTVDVPYGRRNLFPADTANARPSAFAPGDHAFDFSVDFAASARLSWKLSPPAGPITELRADAASPRCDPDNQTLVCADECQNALAAECSDGSASRAQCISDCVQTADFFGSLGCGGEWNAYLRCAGGLGPDAANWDCSFPGMAPSPLSPNCDAELFGVLICAGF